MTAGLVDRLRLVVFPHLLGPSGQQPVFAGYPGTTLTLAGTSVLDARCHPPSRMSTGQGFAAVDGVVLM